MAYVDALVTRYQAPHGYTSWFRIPGVGRDDRAQARFRTNLINRYESKQKGGALLWCPISRAYYESDDMTAAHVVPYNTGESNCNYLFGDAESDNGHLMCPSNGLLLHAKFEKALDDGRIAIVPASKDDIDPEMNSTVNFGHNDEPYKVKVLDATLNLPELNLGAVKGPHLDGRILKFWNDNRPKKRYLWFNTIINIARRRRARVPGWPSDMAILKGGMWASPGEWLRRSTMHCILRQIAFVEDPEEYLEIGLGPTLIGGPEETPFCREIADRVAVKLNPPRAQKYGDEDSPVQSRVYSNPFSQLDRSMPYRMCHVMSDYCDVCDDGGYGW
ncbi:hypothetical protein BDV95DRAFT_655755 [Massariosphaeria phaeospora]|uniref:HNH nuclease domain-containing protein n=1 Tax=Massariosphaeria phaeospora TaxID=100035 RepID=A0A7C8MDZ1_9PLEO|nr:hypothetical protein BDV95DRAFT_655755 [Massariosphaeria phaeospora]